MANYNLPEELYNYYRKDKLEVFRSGEKVKNFNIGRQYFSLKKTIGYYDFIEIKDKALNKNWFAIPTKNNDLNWLEE